MKINKNVYNKNVEKIDGAGGEFLAFQGIYGVTGGEGWNLKLAHGESSFGF
ncbi:MAG: hypothetical protein IK066_05660 [Kiritimatiellae bacterium]|nr:hypothetical protein [Kiritimatiellia bacterium]